MRKSAHQTNPLNRGFKERTIVATLEEYLPSDKPIIKNQSIKGGSRRRPDILIDCYDYVIIIEIDERQHKSYTDSQQRTNDIIHDLQDKFLVMIRFNPDSYRSKGKSYRSLFSKTKVDRIYKIGCTKKYAERTNVLKQVLSYYLEHKPHKSFIQHDLYFNGYQFTDIIELTSNA